MQKVAHTVHDIVGFHLIALDDDSPWSQRGAKEQAIYRAAIESLRSDHRTGNLDLDGLTADLANKLNGLGIGDKGYYYNLDDARRLARQVADEILSV